jgi:uncharacterized protein YecT (DUF1311 family)
MTISHTIQETKDMNLLRRGSLFCLRRQEGSTHLHIIGSSCLCRGGSIMEFCGQAQRANTMADNQRVTDHFSFRFDCGGAAILAIALSGSRKSDRGPTALGSAQTRNAVYWPCRDRQRLLPLEGQFDTIAPPTWRDMLRQGRCGYCRSGSLVSVARQLSGHPPRVQPTKEKIVPRDRIAELMMIRERAGKHRSGSRPFELIRIYNAWDMQLKSLTPLDHLSPIADEVIPIKIVTFFEVYFRNWIENFIDSGAPYVERASRLKIDFKFDFAIAQSLQGGSITFGQLIAHSLSLNRLDFIASTFSTLLDCDFFHAISKTRDRWKLKQEDEKNVGPIIKDVAQIRKTIAKLFEVRHILVHELPEKKPYELSEVDTFLKASINFIDACSNEFDFRLHGDYPMTQVEMTREASERRDAAAQELKNICESVALDTPEIFEVQNIWEAFKEAEAERQAQRHLGGTIRPMLYSLAAESITLTRIEELKNWLENKLH